MVPPGEGRGQRDRTGSQLRVQCTDFTALPVHTGIKKAFTYINQVLSGVNYGTLNAAVKLLTKLLHNLEASSSNLHPLAFVSEVIVVSFNPSRKMFRQQIKQNTTFSFKHRSQFNFRKYYIFYHDTAFYTEDK
jgi:hypothetical protein